MSLYQDAIASWPEDEARMTAEFALSLFETDGRDYYHQWLIKERSCVIHNVFDDDESLIERFRVEFNRLTAPTTNFYF